jgi:hypothetical protein
MLQRAENVSLGGRPNRVTKAKDWLHPRTGGTTPAPPTVMTNPSRSLTTPINRASHPARVVPVPGNTSTPKPSIQSDWDTQNRE